MPGAFCLLSETVPDQTGCAGCEAHWIAPRAYSLRHRTTPKVFPVTEYFCSISRIQDNLGPQAEAQAHTFTPISSHSRNKIDESVQSRDNRGVVSRLSGPVAQLGARFHGMEEVIGSIPIRSTKSLMHSVYILRRQTSGKFYIGCAEHPEARIEEHNRGQTASTRGRGPWTLPTLKPTQPCRRHVGAPPEPGCICILSIALQPTNT